MTVYINFYYSIGPLSPSSLTGFEFGGMAALSEPQSWRRGSAKTQFQQLPQLPETVEEQLEGGAEADVHRPHRSQVERRLSEVDEDLQSELSFTSAHSNPMDSSDSLQHLETTV